MSLRHLRRRRFRQLVFETCTLTVKAACVRFRVCRFLLVLTSLLSGAYEYRKVHVKRSLRERACTDPIQYLMRTDVFREVLAGFHRIMIRASRGVSED